MKHAAAMIGSMAVGAKCARRAGLIELGRKRLGLVKLVTTKRAKEQGPRTMDMLEEEP